MFTDIVLTVPPILSSWTNQDDPSDETPKGIQGVGFQMKYHLSFSVCTSALARRASSSTRASRPSLLPPPL